MTGNTVPASKATFAVEAVARGGAIRGISLPEQLATLQKLAFVGNPSRTTIPVILFGSVMIELGQVSESEVVLAFLRAEIESPNYSEPILKLLKSIGATRQTLIDEPDLQNDCCNALRRVVLDRYRGYIRRVSLFTGFPDDVAWRRVKLEPGDLNRLKYISNEDHWKAYSHGTRRPQRAVESIAHGEFPDFKKKIDGIQEKLRMGVLLPELIAVEGENGDLVLVEGHCRATAYAGLQQNLNIDVFLGYSPLMQGWHFY